MPASGVDADGRKGVGWGGSIVISATLKEDVPGEKTLLRVVGEGDQGKNLHEQCGRKKMEEK